MPKIRPGQTGAVDITEQDLSEEYLPRVYQYISHWVKNTQTAEELTLSLLKLALTRYKKLEDLEDFQTWLFGAAREAARGHNQNNIRKQVQNGQAPEELPAGYSAGGKSGLSFQAGVRGLTTKEYEVIALKFGAELNNGCIARILKQSESVTGSILYRALTRLSERPTAECN